MKCKDCKVWGCQHRTSNAEQECVLQNSAGYIRPSEGAKRFLVPEGTAITIDWSAFRREAAKDILAGMMAHPRVVYGGGAATQARLAIEYADELINQLKEDQAKEITI